MIERRRNWVRRARCRWLYAYINRYEKWAELIAKCAKWTCMIIMSGWLIHYALKHWADVPNGIFEILTRA